MYFLHLFFIKFLVIPELDYLGNPRRNVYCVLLVDVLAPFDISCQVGKENVKFWRCFFLTIIFWVKETWKDKELAYELEIRQYSHFLIFGGLSIERKKVGISQFPLNVHKRS